MKDREDDPASRPHEEWTQTEIKKADPALAGALARLGAAIDAEAQRFRNRDLDHAPPAGDIGIVVRQGPQTVQVVGRDDPDVDAERSVGPHPPYGIPQRRFASPTNQTGGRAGLP